YTGRFQPLQSGYRSAGCGWSADFAVSIPTTWQSGIYAAELRSPTGVPYDVVFCVRPLTPQNKIAVVVPTNTYNAYNTWGGHDQYTSGQDGVQRTVSMMRPCLTTALDGDGVINHTLYSDLFLLQWMAAQNIGFDTYTDLDVDGTGATWMPQYKGVVLLTHPEYWTDQARTNLSNYLNGGGRVIDTGGNVLYERIAYTPDRSAAVFRTPTGDRDIFDDAGEPTGDVLGVDFNPLSYMDFYPYQVNVAHPWLNGTGLTVGSTFGASAYNGPGASGWEVDSYAGTTPGTVVIASGLNPNGGADLCQVPKPNNGWVFTAGSLAFNGAIPNDASIRKILANVFAAAVA
ncbi:MAG TPA: N,N-dimethylformamidase beta subunit family domain-containing protein, partial [Actinospica sp.]|nr:N,N-dimethylformamidase beta subunit family domain-containing protein [Actinospica sp.]